MKLWEVPSEDTLLANQMRRRGARDDAEDDAPRTAAEAREVFFVMPEIGGYMVAPQDVGPEWVFASEVAAKNRARKGGGLLVWPINGRSAHAHAREGFNRRERAGYHDPADVPEVSA